MQKLMGIVYFLLLFVADQALAHVPEEGKVTAILGPFVYQTNYWGSGADVPSPTLGGVGLIAEGDVNDRGGLEIAVFSLNKIYFRRTANEDLAEKVKQIYVTMGYRYWFNERLSVAAAFFSSYIMGSRKIVHSTYYPPRNINTSASDTTEYGFDFSLQYEVWSKDLMAVVLDGRYSYSVTAKPNEYGDHYGMLIGFRYQIQEKYMKSDKSENDERDEDLEKEASKGRSKTNNGGKNPNPF